MMPSTHILLGLAPVIAVGAWWSWPKSHLLAVAVCAVLPDLLHPHIYLSERASWSHSWILPACAALAVPAACALASWPLAVVLACAVALASHLCLDAVSGGISLAWPSARLSGGDLMPRWLWLPAEIGSCAVIVGLTIARACRRLT